ncbi:MAG: hypothetical protein KIT83_01455 [Bryobacterales bacterium]|nr:hypothetical protein [Bryobacterales bacterium]
MKIVLAGAAGLLCAVLGCVLAGFIADLCVSWYHISAFEGGAGYYVVFLALGGLVAGLGIGVVAAGVVLAQGGGPGKAFGVPLAIVFGCACTALALAWFFGDVPPKLGGDTLHVQVELRAPAGWSPSAKDRKGETWVFLRSVDFRNVGGRAEYCAPDWDEMHERDGRPIVQCTLFLFRSSPKWVLEFTFGGKQVVSFLLPFGGRPKASDEAWSDWLPRNGPSPETGGFDYRYRLLRTGQWQAQRKEAESARRAEIQRRFEALTPEAPLREWLEFRRQPDDHTYMVTQQMHANVARVLADRSSEFVALFGDADPKLAHSAIEALPMVRPASHNAIEPMRSAARRIAADIRALGTVGESPEVIDEQALALYNRFYTWGYGWQCLVSDLDIEAPPEMAEIVAAASAHESVSSMDALASLAGQFEREWRPAPALPPQP